MNYRNLRALLNHGASRLVLMVGDDNDTGGAGGDVPVSAPPPAGVNDTSGESYYYGGEDSDDEPAAPAAAAAEEPAVAGGEAPAVEAGGDTAPEPAPSRPTRVPWQAKRIDKLTREAREAQERETQAQGELAEANRRLAAYRATFGEVDPAAAPAAPAPAATAPQPGAGRTYTAEEFQQAVAQQAQLQTLDATLDRWYQDGVKEGGDAFKAKIHQAGQAFPQLAGRLDIFQALTALPNGSKVYEHLAGDLDHMAEVLEMTPLQLGMELARLSGTVGAAPAAAPAPREKPISRAPAPITPVEGRATTAFDPNTANMDDYMKDFEARRQARFESRGY